MPDDLPKGDANDKQPEPPPTPPTGQGGTDNTTSAPSSEGDRIDKLSTRLDSLESKLDQLIARGAPQSEQQRVEQQIRATESKLDNAAKTQGTPTKEPDSEPEERHWYFRKLGKSK